MDIVRCREEVGICGDMALEMIGLEHALLTIKVDATRKAFIVICLPDATRYI